MHRCGKWQCNCISESCSCILLGNNIKPYQIQGKDDVPAPDTDPSVYTQGVPHPEPPILESRSHWLPVTSWPLFSGSLGPAVPPLPSLQTPCSGTFWQLYLFVCSEHTEGLVLGQPTAQSLVTFAPDTANAPVGQWWDTASLCSTWPCGLALCSECASVPHT